VSAVNKADMFPGFTSSFSVIRIKLNKKCEIKFAYVPITVLIFLES